MKIIGGVQKLGRTLLQIGQWLFEWDKEKKQVGKCCGRVVDPHGRDIECYWADGVTEAVPRSFLRLAPQPGAKFGDYTLVGYVADGVEVLVTASKGMFCTPAVARPDLDLCYCSCPYQESGNKNDNNRSTISREKPTQDPPEPAPTQDSHKPTQDPSEPTHAIVDKDAWDRSEEIQQQITELEKSKDNETNVRNYVRT